jgi:hypothetical protein
MVPHLPYIPYIVFLFIIPYMPESMAWGQNKKAPNNSTLSCGGAREIRTPAPETGLTI